MAEIPVQKTSSLTWLWILLGVLLLGLLLWWLLAETDDRNVTDPAATATATADPITDIGSLLGPNAGAVAGREVRLQGVQVQNVGDGGALLVGQGGGDALLVVAEGANVPEGVTAGSSVDIIGIARGMDALGQNRPAIAGNASSDVFVAASAINMAGQAAAAGQAGTPPSVETVAEANRQALQRITNDPNATPRIYFAWESAELTRGAQAVLDQLVQARPDASSGGITLVGFADRSGPRPYNRELSERRAEAVRGYLTGKGIGADLIDVEAEGETPALVETGDGVREPLNRRVRVELSDAS